MNQATITRVLGLVGPGRPRDALTAPKSDSFRLPFLRSPPEDVAACAAFLQEQCQGLGAPPAAAEQGRLGAIDGDGEARVALGHAAALSTEPAIEKAAGVSAQGLGTLCGARQSVCALQLDCQGFWQGATDTNRVIASAIGYIDAQAQALVEALLTSGVLPPAEQQALIVDFTPRLAFLQEDAERSSDQKARLRRTLSPLAEGADDAEEEAAAARTISALRAGKALSPTEVAAALAWERRQKDAEEVAAAEALIAADSDTSGAEARPAARARRRGR